MLLLLSLLSLLRLLCGKFNHFLFPLLIFLISHTSIINKCDLPFFVALLIVEVALVAPAVVAVVVAVVAVEIGIVAAETLAPVVVALYIGEG